MNIRLEDCIGNAVSFPGVVPPNNAKEVGRVTNPTGVFIYYADRDGNIYYKTEAGLKFAEWMEERIEVRKGKGRSTSPEKLFRMQQDIEELGKEWEIE